MADAFASISLAIQIHERSPILAQRDECHGVCEDSSDCTGGCSCTTESTGEFVGACV